MQKSIEETIRQALEPAYFKLFLIPRAHHAQHARIQRIHAKGKVSVCFIVSSLPMWRFQRVYDTLAQDSRFILSIAIYPFPTFSKEEQAAAMESLRTYFAGKRMPLLDLSKETLPGDALKAQLDPDIVFYPQPYNWLYPNDLNCTHFTDRLLCYIPYSIYMTEAPWVYKSFFNNIAWRLFFGSAFSKTYASQLLYNKGHNIRVVGEPMADYFSEPPVQSVWKPQNCIKKKVIWAPHFSIIDEGLHHRDSFSWLSETMWKMAEQYRDRIQVAFKPHPRLRSVLSNLAGWGEDKTQAYYKKWEEGENTQLESGPYVDLFKDSDAMIHDCGSFSVEYHFTGKPALFTTHDIDKVLKDKNEVGRNGLLAHYIGRNEEDVKTFLDQVVLGGIDPKKEERAQFRKKYLIPPDGKSVAEAIYRDLLTGLNL